MTTYNAIAPNLLLPGEPFTSAKVNTLYDNPTAITEGAPGAPRNSPAALAQYSLATEGVLHAPSGELSGASYYAGLVIDTAGTDTGNIGYRTSDDGGATWSGSVTVLSVPASGAGVGMSSGDLSFPAGTTSIQVMYEGSDRDYTASLFTVWGS